MNDGSIPHKSRTFAIEKKFTLFYYKLFLVLGNDKIYNIKSENTET